ncbi:triose-phosphate isomerase family protein [Agilicoccus flavus]|uniref:triose-phosphate isomerase family protein n=1 Tax=Agilicoccus flavus TaxID=2775968 RepID=UPI001CF63AC0|nr:triose-phosphate isomerase family protein [Agilicoccus flavus]
MTVARFLIGSSLKMYFGRERMAHWAAEVADICRSHPATTGGVVQPFVIPSLVAIDDVHGLVADAGVLVGAQDMYWEDAGAFTGEVSPGELVDHGVRLVEIGHAERRALFGETDESVARKVDAAWRHGLVPVLCLGEVERGGAQEAVAECVAQLEASLRAAVEAGRGGDLVLAYEPVWAIGAPEPAGVEHIREVCGALREHLAGVAPVADGRVIYGGSAGPGLLPRIADAVDGMFLGRFAHDPEAFRTILDEAITCEKES